MPQRVVQLNLDCRAIHLATQELQRLADEAAGQGERIVSVTPIQSSATHQHEQVSITVALLVVFES